MFSNILLAYCIISTCIIKNKIIKYIKYNIKMPLRMSMCFTSSKQVNANTNTNINNLQYFKSSSYMNLDQLKKSKGCSACSDN